MAAPVDTGYWTGSLSYALSNGTLTVPLGSIDSNGIAWVLGKVEGWDSPDTAGQVIQRAADHGGYPAAQYYAARMLTLTVTASAADQATRDLARAIFQMACPVSDLATFTYNEPTPKQMLVRRSGRITETSPTLADVQFSAVLVAPDPRKYSTTLSTMSTTTASTSGGLALPFAAPFTFGSIPPAGSVVCTNAGTFECRPVITLAGPITSPTVTNITTGDTISFSTLALASGDTLIIDTDSRQAVYNGALRSADATSSWWNLQPTVPGVAGSGDNTIQLGGTTTGSGSMSISWRSAWI